VADDVTHLRRFAADPDVAADELARWLAERPELLVAQAPQVRVRAAALLRSALEARELDDGRALRALADRQPPAPTYPTWSLGRRWRFAREHGMLTASHARHLARLARARASVRRRRQDVRLHGMAFLGRHVELTAPRGSGRLIVGPWSWIGDGVALRSHHGRVTVGAKVILGGGTVVNSYLDVTIGDGALIADGVHITDFDHRTERVDVPIKDQGIVTSPVRIGPDVWLGRGVTVLRGVDIGEGCVVGAHAVVTRDLPPFSVAVGVPARVVRSRRDG
jgi:acetyltransferase-like isoleucine patch superfamily enzyme